MSDLAEACLGGGDGENCLNRLNRALQEFVIDGIETTLPLFDDLLKNEDFKATNYNIHWLEKFLED